MGDLSWIRGRDRIPSHWGTPLSSASGALSNSLPRMSTDLRTTVAASLVATVMLCLSGCGKDEPKVTEVDEIRVYVKDNAGEILRNAEITARMEAVSNAEEAE